MEKNFENMPFRVGDEVYHPVYGKGEVLKISERLLHVVNQVKCIKYERAMNK